MASTSFIKDSFVQTIALQLLWIFSFSTSQSCSMDCPCEVSFASATLQNRLLPWADFRKSFFLFFSFSQSDFEPKFEVLGCFFYDSGPHGVSQALVWSRRTNFSRRSSSRRSRVLEMPILKKTVVEKSKSQNLSVLFFSFSSLPVAAAVWAKPA